MNLDINVSLNANQLTSLIQGLISLGGAAAGGGGLPAGAPAPGADTPDPAGQLVDLVEGLTSLPSGGGLELPGSTSRPAPTPSASTSSSSSSGGSGGLCSLLGCRATTTSELMAGQTEDVARLVLGPVVTR
jgi:hypothetical protein